jgi:hypothetical protein
MNAIEQLFRKKLSKALAEEKKRIAASLLEVMAAPKTAPGAGNVAKKQGAANAVKNAQAQVQAMQSKAATAKDPVKFKAALQAAKDKLKLAQDKQRIANTK